MAKSWLTLNLLDMQDLLNAARFLLVLAKTSRNVTGGVEKPSQFALWNWPGQEKWANQVHPGKEPPRPEHVDATLRNADDLVSEYPEVAPTNQVLHKSATEVEPTWGFHGGPQEVKQFDPAKKRRGEYGDGFYFTDDHETAERFGPVVSSYKLHLKNPLVVDQMKLHRHLEQATGEKAPRNMAQHGAWITQQARKLGHDGITVNLITGNKYHVTFDPHQIERAELGPAPAIPEGPSIKVKAKTKWEPAF